ncbi:carboxymuconolactone decarboxylase family protein [Corynebacterium camporealensis]|uniref:carboxymuconolactone decarboxylase family protein n=1 Tax=Corynebacterium camporealensis TaxID=161896 RepID=UPI002A90FD63|nr:carboxymuconolactone decarboxylase family protein [Corynebacterium camporealensis]
MSLIDLLETLPTSARDQVRNLEKVLGSKTLDSQQRWSAFIGAAVAIRDERFLRAVLDDAAAHVPAETIDHASQAAVAMATSNIAFRAKEWLDTEVRTGLRTGMASLPRDPAVELSAVAASAINGCKDCLRAHAATAQELGLNPEQVWEAVRIAAACHGVTHALLLSDARS